MTRARAGARGIPPARGARRVDVHTGGAHRQPSFGGRCDGGPDLPTKLDRQAAAVAFQDGATVGDVYDGLFAGGQVAIAEQVPIDIGSGLVGRVARCRVGSITEQSVQEREGVGNVVAMQMHGGHKWVYLRDGGDDGRSGAVPRSVTTTLAAS